MSDTTQNNDVPSAVNFEWAYSGKAMRAQALLYLLVTLFAVSGVAYIAYAKPLGTYTSAVCYGILGCLVLLWGQYYAVYLYRTWTIRYRLTERHLYSYRGLVTHSSDSMELILINDARLVQTLFDRIFNGGVGTILFSFVRRTIRTANWPSKELTALGKFLKESIPCGLPFGRNVPS